MPPFEGDEHPALSNVMSRNFDKPRQRGHGSCNDGIKAVAGCIVLRARFHGRDVAETEQADNMLHKPNLLVVAIDENEMPLWFGNRERQAGEAGTGTNVEYALPHEKRPCDQAVEQVPGDHLLDITNRREIDLAVPPIELFEQCRALYGDVSVKRLIELINRQLDIVYHSGTGIRRPAVP